MSNRRCKSDTQRRHQFTALNGFALLPLETFCIHLYHNFAVHLYFLYLYYFKYVHTTRQTTAHTIGCQQAIFMSEFMASSSFKNEVCDETVILGSNGEIRTFANRKPSNFETRHFSITTFVRAKCAATTTTRTVAPIDNNKSRLLLIGERIAKR